MAATLDDDLFPVITFLVTCALLSLEETPVMGAFRMVDAAHRLIAVLEQRGEADEFLASADLDYLENFPLVMTDQDGFVDWLENYARTFAQAAVTRNG